MEKNKKYSPQNQSYANITKKIAQKSNLTFCLISQHEIIKIIVVDQ